MASRFARILSDLGLLWRRPIGLDSMPSISDLAVSPLPTPKYIFFVVGHPKSGTTWVSTILDNHPQIACRYEGHFFPRSDGYLTLANALANSELLCRWMKRDFNRWIRNRDEELRVFVRLIAQFYMQREVLTTGKPIVGDKSPTYTLKPIYDIFPQASIIHVIRDGRDVAVSMAYHRSKETERYMTHYMAEQLDEGIRLHKTTGQAIDLPLEYIRRVARTWREEVSTCRREGRQCFDSRYLEVRYEKIHEDPDATVSDVLGFLGASNSQQVIKHCVSQASFSRLTGGRHPGEEDPQSFFRKGIVGDWRNVFRKRQVDVFNDIAGDLLEELGYV